VSTTADQSPIPNVPPRHVNRIPEEGDDNVFSQSWFVMCMSSEVAPGQLKGLDFLDGRVVVYRDAAGKAHVLSAYCPHMGADLACGKVNGNEVICAFHEWSFGANGKCTKTGIGEHVPPNAAVFAFPTEEKYGLIWAFNGTTPLWELPNFAPPHNDDSKLIWAIDHRSPTYKCSPWVFCCNTLDLQHIIQVHKIQFPLDTLNAVHDAVRWQPFGYDYDLKASHQGGFSLSWQLGIRGTSFYWQQGLYNGFWFGFVTGFGMRRPGTHECYLSIAVEAGDGTPEGDEKAQANLKAAMDLEIRTVEEDREILNNIHFAPGHLLRVDRSAAKFFQFLRSYPRAHPARDYIT
jgi:phenylpropionate dioxygenase-like ring-hydroxylating dioxygenase large terminal subunit